MVFFTCNNCGTTIKKNQVSTHKFKCKNGSVSCMDCGKDFWGTEYEAHIKCISEEEKYSGKNFVPKASSNKGQKRQDDWLDCLNQLLKTGNLKSNIRNVIAQLVTMPNVPQKKTKFENFIRNMNLRSPAVIAEVWDVVSKALEELKASKSADNKLPGGASVAKNKDLENVELKSETMENESKLKMETVKDESKKRKKNKKGSCDELLIKREILENIQENDANSELKTANKDSKKRKKQKKNEILENIEGNDNETKSEMKTANEKSKKRKKQKKSKSDEQL